MGKNNGLLLSHSAQDTLR